VLAGVREAGAAGAAGSSERMPLLGGALLSGSTSDEPLGTAEPKSVQQKGAGWSDFEG